MERELDAALAALLCDGIVEVVNVVEAAVCPPLVADLPPCDAADMNDAIEFDMEDNCSGESDDGPSISGISVLDKNTEAIEPIFPTSDVYV